MYSPTTCLNGTCREICSVNLLFLSWRSVGCKRKLHGKSFRALYLELNSPRADRIISSKRMFTDVLLHAQVKSLEMFLILMKTFHFFLLLTNYSNQQNAQERSINTCISLFQIIIFARISQNPCRTKFLLLIK